MNAQELAERLGAKRVGDTYMAKCPAHDDTTPSLAIKDGREGVVYHCHGGCSQDAVTAALPVAVRELFNAPRVSSLGREVCAYDYHDEAGTLLYQIVRFEPKTFRMRHPDPAGGFTPGLNGARRVPYYLPELVAGVQAGKRVWIVEGEKDADAIRVKGQVATTNPGGAGKWLADYNEHFRGADVVVVADRDEPGRAHAKEVARQLQGVAAKVVIVEPAAGKDVTDHLAAGRKLAELVPIEPAPLTTPSTDADGFIKVGDLIAEPDDAHPWVVDGLIPSGGLVLVAAKPKVGKSTLARAIALRVCRGEPVLGRTTMQGPVLYLGLEDPRAAIKGHFRRMGAVKSDDLAVFPGSVPDHAQVWLGEMLTKRDPVLVIIDTMQFFLGVTDLNDYAQVVTALRSILALVRGKSRAAVMVIHHAGKGDRQGFDAVLGSTGITGTVDTTVLLKRRHDDNTRTISTQQRMHAPGGEDMPETVLNLDEHTEPCLAGTRAEYDLARRVEDVVAYLSKTVGEWQERADVLAGLEGKNQDKIAALDAAFRSGLIERQGEGKRGNPFLFRVTGTAFTPPEKPYFRSPTTVGTAERKPKDATTPSGNGSYSVPPFLALRENPIIPGTETKLCHKGHVLRQKAGSVGDGNRWCPVCNPALTPILAPNEAVTQ